MEMTGEERIRAPREKVYAALNDPEILKQCIPGCKEIVKKSDTELEAKAGIAIGPVKANFTGAITLSDLNPPVGYTISGEGKGGPAGFAKGGAKVSLAEDGADTILTYDVKADIGGKLAQLGSRLIDSTAKKMAKQFFSKFGDLVGEEAPADEASPVAAAVETVSDAAASVQSTAQQATEAASDAAGGMNNKVIIGVVAAAIVLALIYFVS